MPHPVNADSVDVLDAPPPAVTLRHPPLRVMGVDSDDLDVEVLSQARCHAGGIRRNAGLLRRVVQTQDEHAWTGHKLLDFLWYLDSLAAQRPEGESSS